MNFVIPMAGYGSRFVKAGYQFPKMLLKAHGKTLLEWSLNSLPLYLANRVVFVGLMEHENGFGLQEIIQTLYPTLNSKFIFIDKVTSGQAETTYIALKECDKNESLVIFNIDTFFSSSTLEHNLQQSDIDGVLGYFTSSENRFSFAALDNENKYIKEVREKEVISTNALTGLYTFNQINDFVETYDYHVKNKLTIKGEYYIAPMYDYLIQQGKKYILDRADKHYILGTPEEYSEFLKLENF
ncbi:MAG: NTP transferase domain-containing protein [Janthinobacterium lividum]